MGYRGMYNQLNYVQPLATSNLIDPKVNLL